MALTVRIGNELGAGNPLRAKQATYAAFGITCEQTKYTQTLIDCLFVCLFVWVVYKYLFNL